MCISKKSFYALSFTWGILMTVIGLIVAVVLLALGYKPKRWGGCIYFVSKRKTSWGDVNLGIVFITDKQDRESNKNHEFGHAIQNCRYGLLMPFIVCIPSFVRYQYRNWRTNHGMKNETAYDDIWFEGEATSLGNEHIKCWQTEE